MGRTGTSNPNAAPKEPRITLKNYLDMSKSLIVEPSTSRTSERLPPSRDLRRWDMNKSMNADPGYFSNSRLARSKVGLGLDSGVAVSSPGQDLAVAGKGLARSSRAGLAPAKSPLSEMSLPSRASFHAGLNNSKTLPTSPGVSDPEQEKELIEAFVDQLRNIAASSSEPSATTRRVVRKALEFSSHLTAAQRAAVVEYSPASAARAPVEDPRRPRVRMHATAANGERVVSVRRELLRHHQRLPCVVEEKQTVISSPIVHSSSTTASKTKLKSVDMAPAVQEHAIECAFQLLRGMDKLNCKLLAWQLKKEFDKAYGPAWHCIVGTSFGSYVTHTAGGFIYFAVGKVSILLFRTAIEVVDKK